MTKPLISIVLPTHNGKRFIDQSIDSVVNQAWRDWELIVVNDASTDDTPAAIDRWAARDSRITAVHLPKNRTLPGALNEGFSRAWGEYHSWTSDDNWYHPEAFARMLAVLQGEPAAAITHAHSMAVDESGAHMGQIPTGSAAELYVMNRIGACFLYRREVTAQLKGYDEELFGAEDYDFWLRASLHFHFHRLPEQLYYYRRQSGSLSARKYRMISRNVEKAVRRWLPQMSWPDDGVRYRAYVEWGIRCLRAGAWEDVYEPWLQAAPWLDAPARLRMRREVLTRLTEVALEAYCRRDWDDFERCKAYLSEVADDPSVARLLTRRIYPRWTYAAKDRLEAIRRWTVGRIAGRPRA